MPSNQWQKQGVGDFKYHVGIGSLTQVATREDRVSVSTFFGGESSDVTPVSHAYSGGNVVFGTAPARAGRCSRHRSATSPSTTTCAKGWRPGTTSTRM